MLCIEKPTLCTGFRQVFIIDAAMRGTNIKFVDDIRNNFILDWGKLSPSPNVTTCPYTPCGSPS
jgi:hypothetical protein